VVSVIILIIINIACLPFLIKEMAKKDFIFTLVKEGTAKAIMGSGDSGFQRFLWEFKGYKLDDEWNVLNDTDQPNNKRLKQFLGLSGVYFLGIPGLHSVHKYKFRWNSLKQAPDSTTKEAGGIYFTSHDEELDYIILQQDVYYARIESAEDKNMVPLNFDVTLPIRINNPYKALFVAQEWLEMTWGIVLPALRRFVAKQEWGDLSQRIQDKEKDFIKDIIQEFNNLDNSFGVEIASDKFRIIRISPAGKRAEMYEAAATKQYEAEQKAKEIKVLAEAERDRIDKVYGKIEEFKELGQIVLHLESFVKAANSSGNMIFSMPELTSFASAIQKISKKLP